MYWSCGCIYGVVQLFSGKYMKLIEVLVDKKGYGWNIWKSDFCANVHDGNVNKAPSNPIIGYVQILKCLED